VHDISSISNSRAADFGHTAVGGVISDTAHAAAGATAGGVVFNTASAAGASPGGVASDTAHSTTCNTVFTVQAPKTTVRVNQTQDITPSLDANSIVITEADI